MERVGKALGSLFAQSTVENVPPCNPTLYIETDIVVLRAMEAAGLIGDSTVPAVIWADAYMKGEFLDAGLLEGGEESASESRKHVMHYSDILNIPPSYYKNVFDYLQPAPLPGSFGSISRSKADVDNLLEEDPNVGGIYNSYATANPVMANRIPIFTLGVKSPNVLKVDLDVNNVYTNFIQVAKGRTKITNILNSNFILGKTSKNIQQFGLNATNMAGFFANFKEMSDKKYEKDAALAQAGVKDPFWVPEEFKELVKPVLDQYYHSKVPWGGVATVLNTPGRSIAGGIQAPLGTFDDAFSKLQSSGRTNVLNKLGGVQFPRAWSSNMDPNNLKGDDKKIYEESILKFYKIMWAAYSDLYSEAGENYLDQSTSYVQYSGKNSVTQSIRQTASLTQKMMNTQLVGKISTLPMFSLSNTRLAMNRSCLLYSREPRFSNVGLTQGNLENTSWFSGMYRLYGWHHTISKGEATSKFLISRDLRYAPLATYNK